MTERNIILFLVFAYLFGVAGGWGIYNKNKPSEEQRLQMQVDVAIQNGLCDRIREDIDKYKITPHTFQRSSLKVLLSESVETSKALVANLPDGHIVKFKGVNGSIVSACQTEATQWVKIPTVFPEQYEAEVALVGNKTVAGQVDISFKAEESVSGIAEKRLALVIGNASYRNTPLKNPVNDAEDMAKALTNVGFTVIELHNADLDEMRSAVAEFSQQLINYDVGLVYYSGHGIEFSGRNYFLPINVNIKTEEEIPRQGFDASQIVENMSRNNVKTSIFIIDACRNAPIFSKYRSPKSGLTSMQVSNGSIVAFSAAPGQVAIDGNGRNSPYTKALLQQIQIPNKKIEEIMKDTGKLVIEYSTGRQVPWYNSSLVGDFYFIKQ